MPKPLTAVDSTVTLLDVIKQSYAAVFELWDGDSYKISAPCSVKDAAYIFVTLKNKSGSYFTVTLPIGERVTQKEKNLNVPIKL